MNEEKKEAVEYDVEFNIVFNDKKYPIKTRVRTSDKSIITNKIKELINIEVTSVTSTDPRDKRIEQLERELETFSRLFGIYRYN